MHLSRPLIEKLIYGDEAGRRQTQDSPVLPDVWIRYGCWTEYPDSAGGGRPDAGRELLLTPRFGATPGEVAGHLRTVLPQARADVSSHRLAYNQTYVAVNLTYRDLVRCVLPMTEWWRSRVRESIAAVLPRSGKGKRPAPKGDASFNLRSFLQEYRRLIEKDLDAFGSPMQDLELPADLVWMIRLVGSIAYVLQQPAASANNLKEDPVLDEELPSPQQVVSALIKLFTGLKIADPTRQLHDEDRKVFRLVYLVNMNRRTRLAVTRSTLAIKADAARRLFEMDCSQLCWAVIDSGIDARHPAFYQPRDGEKDPRTGSNLGKDGKAWMERTRVERTYDFTRIRDLLSAGSHDPDKEPLKSLLDRIKPATRRKEFIDHDLAELRARLARGRGVDWALLEPLLRVPHDNGYTPPASDHGTHVAGILGADWPQRTDYKGAALQGVCPGLRLFDLRVIDPTRKASDDDEFAVIAALQFITHLNDQKDYFAVHGVNMSLAIPHEVANYACGRTPVCDECSRLVSTGVVVVAAAGNEGYLQYRTATGDIPGYHTVSITDPGNAESVITVGSTHRFLPHTYGVSYFSSRGPTGDGRIKPDLVAPGEKIWSPITSNRVDYKDGTSMAAPHVSGAAALLMARHSELIGDPERIKRVLCSAATDLGRERYFQGAGMLDVLRALQAV